MIAPLVLALQLLLQCQLQCTVVHKHGMAINVCTWSTQHALAR